MRAAIVPGPTSTAAASRVRAATPDYAAAIDDPRVDAVVIAVPPRLSSRPDAARARGRQARAGREARVSAPRRLPDGDRRAQPGEARRARRRKRSLQAAGRGAADAGRGGRDRRDGVRALHDDREAAEVARTTGATTRVMAGGDAFFEEGIHWLHIAGSLGPRIVSIDGYRPVGLARRARTRARRA